MQTSPLQSLRVIELASVLAGPSVGQFFAEWGATVIKIENQNPGGDVTRTWKLPSESRQESRSSYFACCNWGKTSIALDLHQNEDRQRVYDLIAEADLVITSYKAGDAQKLGMDYVSLKTLKSDLIYGKITGYPEGDTRVGYDGILQAETGFTYLNGEADTGSQKMPVALIDVLAAHQLKEGLLIALLRRTQTGQGAEVSVSLFEAGVSSLANQATAYLTAGQIPHPKGSDHPNIVPYGTIFQTRTCSIVLGVGSDAQFQRLAKLLGYPEWVSDERFSTNPARVKHREAIKAKISAVFLDWNGEELLSKLHQENIPAGDIRDMKAVFEDKNTRQIMLEDGDFRAVRLNVARIDGKLPDFPLSTPPKF
ncbi:MAG: CoA transferase [Bacteroidota bacterium]